MEMGNLGNLKMKLTPKRIRIAAAAGVTAAAFAVPLIASPGLSEPHGNGRIEWTEGYIEARGQAVPPADAANAAQGRLKAFRAAKIDAQRNLLEICQSVRVTSNSTVKDFMQVSDAVSVQVTGVLKGAVVVEEKVDSVEGSDAAVVRMRAPIRGNITGALYDYLVKNNDLARKGYPLIKIENILMKVRHAFLQFVLPAPAHADVPAPGAASLQAPEIAPGTKTGIVLDLTDIQVKPELLPTITDDKGVAIVSPKLLDRRVAIEKGLVSYSSSVAEAKEMPRSGADPLVLKALNFVAGTESGIKVQLADGMGMEAAKKTLKDPTQVFKDGITVAYRVTW